MYEIQGRYECEKNMMFEHEAVSTICNINLNGMKVDQVNEFVYIKEVRLIKKNSTDGEISRWVNATLNVTAALDGFHGNGLLKNPG